MPPSVYVRSGYRAARSNTGLAGNGPNLATTLVVMNG